MRHTFERDYFLKKHGIVLDTSKSVEEQILKMAVGFGVQDSVSDDRPYIFISYAHKDSAVVLPAIKALQDKGYRIWYDAGIRPGMAWSDYIADHVRNAALVIAFMSEHAIASPHCLSEIRYAFNKGRPMLTVMLDQSQMPSGLDMQLSQWHMVTAYAYDGDTFLVNLAGEGFIADTIAAERHKDDEQKRDNEAAEHGYNETDELKQKYDALKRDYGKLSEQLKRENYLREDAERKHKNAEETIANLRSVKSEPDESKLISKKEKEEKAILAKLHDEAKKHTHDQTFAGYNVAINICKNGMSSCVERAPKLKSDRKNYINDILATMYHDARGFEKSEIRKAYAIYQALPETYEDVRFRRNEVYKKMQVRTVVFCVVLAVLHLAANCLAIKCFYTLESPLWSDLLVFTGPMLAAVGMWLWFSWSWCKTEIGAEMYMMFMLTFIAVSILCLVVDPFLYPKIPGWLKIMISLGTNVFPNTLAIVGLVELVERIPMEDRFNIQSMEGIQA